jgi:hypothetical protein
MFGIIIFALSEAAMQPDPRRRGLHEDWFLLEHEMPRGGAHRSHWRLVLPLICVVPGSLTYSVPLFLRRQCNRTLGAQLDLPARTAQVAAAEAVVAVAAGGGSR